MTSETDRPAAARLAKIQALFRKGQAEAAVGIAVEAVRQGARDLMSVRVAAVGLRQAGRFDEAIAILEEVAGAAPGDAARWTDLAEAFGAAQRPEPALAAWDRALMLAPHSPEALCGKARALQSQSRVGEAASLFRQALAIDRTSYPARLGLAGLFLEAGRLEEAETLARDVTAEAPARVDAAWLISRIVLARGDPEAAMARLQALLAMPQAAPVQRAEALLALGEALDRLGRPAEAFAAAVEGKAIQGRLYAQRAVGREGEVAKLERLARWFGGAAREEWSPAPRRCPAFDNEARRHVFLVGFPRSGTTLLEQALAGHPDVVALEEAPTLAGHQHRYLTSAEGCEALARLTADEADALRARYWGNVAAHGAEVAGKVFIDKAPAGTLRLPLAAKLFPDATVLFAVRDPRDVVLSCLRNAFQINAMTYAFTTLEETAACYRACMALADVYRAVLPMALHEVRHESLVGDLEGGLARICGPIGLAPHPAMHDVAATAARRSVRTPSPPQVRAGLNRAGVGRWRAYASQLQPVMDVLAPWVERFGYGD